MKNIFSRKTAVKLGVFLFMLILGYLVGGGLAKAFGQSPPSDNHSIFFKVSGKNLREPSYLLGTYHLLKSGYINQFPAIQSAFSEAKGVVVEVVLDSAELAKYSSLGLLQNNTISELVGKQFADSLNNEVMQTIGAPLAAVERLTPMNLMTTLALVQLMKDNDSLLNAYNGSPMDQSVANAAAKLGKTLTPLETLEMQMNLLFNSYSLNEQTMQLKDYLRNKEQGRQLGNALVKSYLSHDLDALQSIYDATLALTKQTDKLVKDRNLNWMKVLPGLMQEQNQFVAVGALHLAGPDGLVNQLRQQGYTVTAIAL
jgi:uncharacterized protein YbaP (TraB family)